MTWFAWTLLAVFLWGLAPVFAKIGLVQLDPLQGLTIRSLAVAAGLVAVNLARGTLGTLLAVQPRAVAFVVAEGLAGSLLAHLAYYYALKHGEASLVVPVSAAYPVIAVILAVAFLHEKLTAGRVAGMLLIVAGVFITKLF